MDTAQRLDLAAPARAVRQQSRDASQCDRGHSRTERAHEQVCEHRGDLQTPGKIPAPGSFVARVNRGEHVRRRMPDAALDELCTK
jgi:hypothetical protein